MEALEEVGLRWRRREFGELVGGEEVERSAAGFGGQDGVEVRGEVVDVADVGDVGFGFGFVDGGGGAVPQRQTWVVTADPEDQLLAGDVVGDGATGEVGAAEVEEAGGVRWLGPSVMFIQVT